MTYEIKSIKPFGAHQIIIWLADEQSHATGPNGASGPQWCVRITVDKAATHLRAFLDAYAQVMSELTIDVAAGGCRTCKNKRKVNQALFDFDNVTGEPCPVCLPRAEERIRKAAMITPKERPH